MDIFKAFRRAASALNPFSVSAKSKVKGFDVTLEKVEGHLLTEKGTDKPASENHYYVVSVASDGSNPEYPATEKLSKYHFTVGLADSGMGYTNGVCFVPAGSKWTRFEVVEKFDDCKNTMGHRLAPHHAVGVLAYYKDAQGRESNMQIGGWIRKSDKESAAFKSALQNRTFYI